MDRATALKILRLREVISELNAYADYREAVVKDGLLTASLDDVKALQGRYQEIRKLRTLTDEIKQALQEK